MKKISLWKLRFERLKSTKTESWTIVDLKKALKSLKTNKTRDPSGLINELFKFPTIGCDLENAILSLANGIKSSFYVPKIMQISNITYSEEK